tara:strand:- start:1 stop:426 length:426 start_codon:yes stop_codon:yes gene_type:complete
VLEVAITSLVISTGIVTLAPESTPSSVSVVSNFVFDPNNVVLLIAVKLNEVPLIVSLNAELLNGLAVVEAAADPTPSNDTNSLLSAIVAKYPPGSVMFAKPWKFKVFGFTEVVAPSDNWILDILAVMIGNLVVPLGNVTNL